MHKKLLFSVATLVLSVAAGYGQIIEFKTDRLGYSGTATRYGSLADLNGGTNVLDSNSFSDRDAAIYIEENAYSIVMTAWYYTANGGGKSPAGTGGPGFMQQYDVGFGTVDNYNMVFDGYDGTYWTEAKLFLEGSNSVPNSRYSFISSAYDSGEYLNYTLDITVGGLTGQETAPGWVEANGHPGSVTGTFHAIFENKDPDDSREHGFYEIEIEFNMDNWAFAQGDNLDGDLSDSYFAAAAVPEPATVGAMAVAFLGGMIYLRRKRK